jgi:hypothetical protein
MNIALSELVMAARTKSHPPVLAHSDNWDYTETEWARICSVIKKVRPDPLNDTERYALRITANDYLADSRNRSNKRHTLAAERRQWERASKHISKLLDVIKVAVGIHNGLRRKRDQQFFLVTQEIMAAVLGQQQPSPETIKIQEKQITVPFHVSRGSHIMTVDELRILLSQLKVQIDIFADVCRYGPGYLWSYTGRTEPRVPYMQQILWLWTYRFRGKLTLSVDPADIPVRVSGPLVDYVSAVAGPVMKERVPKPSALRDCRPSALIGQNGLIA